MGIIISGMINPAKVTNFFDITGTWDPSLAFVMLGALTITFIGYRVTFLRKTPILTEKFDIPQKKHIDKKLIFGSALFGIGWGITGFCPGGAIPAIGTGLFEVLLFIAALVSGIIITRLFQNFLRN